MPKVSILLTCYNHIAYLPAAVESIRGQTFQDFEVICLDDGSSDGTRDWLRTHCADWTLQFNETNLGTYGSLNKGLEMASGELIAILNDDDVWDTEKLTQQVAMLDSDGAVGLVHTNGSFIGAHGEPLPGTPLGFDFPRDEKTHGVIPLLYANKIIASAVLVRRACFDEVGRFNPAYFGSGDWDMWLRVAEKWSVGFCNDELTKYRWHGDNASKKLDRIWRDDEMLRERIIAQTPAYEAMVLDPNELNAALAHNWACLGTVRTLNGDPRQGREAYKESLRRQPSRWRSRLRFFATYLPRSVFRRML